MSATFEFTKTRKADGSSEPFPESELDGLRTAYEAHTDRLTVVNGGIKKTLKGLRFDASDIREIIDQTDCTDLFLIFIESPLNKDNITVVATGIFPDATNPDGKIDRGSKMFDYCEPCPNKCPSNL